MGQFLEDKTPQILESSLGWTKGNHETEPKPEAIMHYVGLGLTKQLWTF